MPVLRDEQLPVATEYDVVIARQTVRKWAAELGFNLVDQTKVLTAASELARNVLVHGGGGTARLEILNDGSRRGLRLTFEDQGPGIPDIELAAARRLHDRIWPRPGARRVEASGQ